MKRIDVDRLKLTIIGLKDEAVRCDYPDMVHAFNLVLILLSGMAEEGEDGQN